MAYEWPVKYGPLVIYFQGCYAVEIWVVNRPFLFGEKAVMLLTPSVTAVAVPLSGRNYKLLPALATNSPVDCLLNASRLEREATI